MRATYWRKAGLLFAGSVLVATALCALAGPWIAPFDPSYQFVGSELMTPSLHHILGTDELGRDLFSRIIVGARLTLMVVVFAVPLGGSIGSALGIISGYHGGRIDALLARVSDVSLAIPVVAVGVVLALVYHPGVLSVIGAIAFFNVGLFARVARGATIGLREEEFMLVARALGVSTWRLLRDHVVPNVGPLLTIQLGVSAASAILFQATLAFLGLGAQPPAASWGSMLRSAEPYLSLQPEYAIAPGIAIVALVFSVNLMTDWLRDRLDPRALS